jgi:hypothetical protein
MSAGSRVKYYPYKNKLAQEKHGNAKYRKGTVLQDFALGEMLDVALDGDPVGTYLAVDRTVLIEGVRDDNNPLIHQKDRIGTLLAYHREVKKQVPTDKRAHGSGRRVQDMATATKPSARELRKQAKALRIRGWEDMNTAELSSAIEAASEDEAPAPRRAKATAAKATAKKSTGRTPVSSKTPAQKAKAAPAEVAENGNPFKEGTNLWYITEELIGGGKRSAMVKRLKKKIELKPRTNTEDFDLDFELDRRVLIIGQLLRKDHGFTVTREGRGPDATIVAEAP